MLNHTHTHTHKINTVQEVLCQVKEKTEAQKNKEANLFYEKAIYCKVLEV